MPTIGEFPADALITPCWAISNKGQLRWAIYSEEASGQNPTWRVQDGGMIESIGEGVSGQAYGDRYAYAWFCPDSPSIVQFTAGGSAISSNPPPNEPFVRAGGWGAISGPGIPGGSVTFYYQGNEGDKCSDLSTNIVASGPLCTGIIPVCCAVLLRMDINAGQCTGDDYHANATLTAEVIPEGP